MKQSLIGARTGTTHPRLSVGLPVYNGARYLASALNSLLAQDFEDFEIVISDNASTDETPAICTEYAKRDPRIRYYRNEANIGSARNFNRVFELSRGEFFKWAAHDDECHPSLFRRCIETFDASPESVCLVYAQCVIIDETGAVTRGGFDHLETHAGRPHLRLAHVLRNIGDAHPVYGFVRSDVMRRTQLMRSFISNDYIFLAEIAMLGEIREVPEVLFQMRFHDQNAKVVNSTRRALTIWYDPQLASQTFWLPPGAALVNEYLRSVRLLSLPPTDKLLCAFTAPAVHYWRRFRNMLGRQKRWALGFGSKPVSTTENVPSK